MERNATPFPTLITPRLHLREIVASDLASVHRALSDPRVTAYYAVSFATLDETRTQMEWFEDLRRTGTGIWWAVCSAEDPRTLIGACGLNNWAAEHRRAELGFWLLPEAWGQSFMREALEALLTHAFTSLEMHRIEAEVEAENLACMRLLERLGFTCEGTRRACELSNGKWIDVRWYARLATDPGPEGFATRRKVP